MADQTPSDLIERLLAEASALDALLAGCESPLHGAAVGCPYCKRDTRHRNLLREAAATLQTLENEKEQDDMSLGSTAGESGDGSTPRREG